MQPERIEIVAMRTWGEFGNLLAAQRLARVLAAQLPGAEVNVREAEDFLPRLEAAGAEIRDITITSPTPAVRTARYLALMDRVRAAYPDGLEALDPAQLPFRAELEPLAAHLRAAEPDLVIGTKGVISRLCHAALALGGDAVPVMNYVTNPGLLELPIHRSPHVASVVPSDRARKRLRAEPGFEHTPIFVAGPLIAEHELKGFLVRDDAGEGSPPAAALPWGGGDAERPRVIVFCNRGGEEYLRLVRHLASRHPEVELVFISYNHRELTRAAAEIAAAAGLHAWRFHDSLRQAQYFEYVNLASRADHALLISKSGPNSVLEAAYFGIPVLALESGLPMEAWVRGLIEEEAALGRCCGSMNELLPVLDTWLARREIIVGHKRNARAYAAQVLDQAAVAGRLRQAVLTILGAGAPCHSAAAPHGALTGKNAC
jgi:glycosyltransferase involved in cell wall biosynthesis